MAASPDRDAPESVSRRFLSALSEGRWEAAAELISVDSAERLRDQLRYITRHVANSPPAEAATDTAFLGPLRLLHLDGVDALASLTAREVLIRWMRALHPAAGESDPPEIGLAPRIDNVLLECRELSPTRAETRYRAEWHTGDGRRLANRDTEQTLSLSRAEGGRWRIVDVDLAGTGHAHLTVPDDDWQRLRKAVGGT